jgi:hypothetical protein
MNALDLDALMGEFGGGMEEFGELLRFYFENFYSDAEKAAANVSGINTQLAAFNLQMPATRQGWRDLVDAQDRNTESGRKALAMLLRLTPAADQYYDALEAVPINTSERGAGSIDSLSGSVDGFGNVIIDVADIITRSTREIEDAGEDLRAWLDSLKIDPALSPLSPADQLAEARRQYLAALSSGSGITDAGRNYLELARDYYGSSAGYNSIFAQVSEQVGALGDEERSVPRLLTDILRVSIQTRDAIIAGNADNVEATEEVVTATRDTSWFSNLLTARS